MPTRAPSGAVANVALDQMDERCRWSQRPNSEAPGGVGTIRRREEGRRARNIVAKQHLSRLPHDGNPAGAASLKILVLGTGTRAFLTVVRSLGRAGHEVHVAWTSSASPELSSRYIRHRHQLSRFRADDESWLTEFEQLLNVNEIDLVIPCSDPVIIPLQAASGSIRTKARIYLLPDEQFRTANSKIEMDRLVRELGIPVAAGTVIANEQEAWQAFDAIPPPWVFKPETSYSPSGSDVRQEVRKAYTRHEAERLIPGFLAGGRFQLQRNFVGVGTGVEVLCADGEILLAFQHVRVHEPLHGGGSSYRRAVPLHAGMLDATRRLMARLGYTGVAMVEFKWNRDSDEWIFIELNARFWGSLPLAVACGADFPRALVELLISGKRSFDYHIRDDLWARNIELDVDWLLANIRSDKRDATLSALPWSAVFGEVLNILRGNERWDTLALDDPKPFVHESANVAGAKLRAMVRRAIYSDGYLTASRFWRRHRLWRRLRSAKRVGFICYGNICRSPFAESYARTSVGRLSFFSAGFHNRLGRTVPAQGLSAARQFDVELVDHRSKRLTQDGVESADLLFVFDRWNLRQMRLEFPDAAAKTFLLSDLADVGRLEISDPWDREASEFAKAYTTICACIDALGNFIKGI